MSEVADIPKIPHSMFRKRWTDSLDNRSFSMEQESTPIEYGDGQYGFLCEDLTKILTVLNAKLNDLDDDESQSENTATMTDICRSIFREEALKLERIKLYNSPSNHLWYNKTTKGINLRPGFIGMDFIGEFPEAVHMKGESAHAIVAGRTGSGKSVFLNNLIINLIEEYPPWELALYLADFKKVEMSRYMQNGPSFTPHVRACAATSEIRYVLSLIKYIKESKDQRELLFARLGIQDIESFRNEFADLNIVMPRILLIIDEFQQMFLDATAKQSDEIKEMLMDITRKGRAAGVHLLFASQEMSGTGISLPNFKIRFALACDSGVSTDILGNSGAATLPKYGQVIVNTKSKFEHDNVTYTVPFVNDDVKTRDFYFTDQLTMVCSEASSYDFFYKGQKFYREDQQIKAKKLEMFLQDHRIKNERQKYANAQSFISSLVLGRSVEYNRLDNDIENILLERGKSRALLGVSTSNMDLAYMQKLIALNLKFSPVESKEYDVDGQIISGLTPNWRYKHYYYNLNPIVESMYDVRTDLPSELGHTVNVFRRENELRYIESTYQLRQSTKELLLSTSTAQQYCSESIQLEQQLSPSLKPTQADLDDIFNQIALLKSEHEIPRLCRRLHREIMRKSGNIYLKQSVSIALSEYYRYNILNTPIEKIFSPLMLWISGVDKLSRVKKELLEIANNGTDVNIYCFFFAMGKVDSSLHQACNYVFVGGLDNDLYGSYIGYTTARKSNSVVLEGRIKSISKTFAFKKYRTDFTEDYKTSINFDDVLSQAMFQ